MREVTPWKLTSVKVTVLPAHTKLPLLTNSAAQSTGSLLTPVAAKLLAVHKLFRWAVLLFRAASMRVFCPSVNILEQ